MRDGQILHRGADPLAHLKRVLRSEYRIDNFQATYFVIEDFEELFEASKGDLLPVYAEIHDLPDVASTARLPEDVTVAL